MLPHLGPLALIWLSAFRSLWLSAANVPCVSQRLAGSGVVPVSPMNQIAIGAMLGLVDVPAYCCRGLLQLGPLLGRAVLCCLPGPRNRNFVSPRSPGIRLRLSCPSFLGPVVTAGRCHVELGGPV